MRRRRTTISVLGVAVICAVAAMYWRTAEDDSLADDGKPLPPPPTVPEGATPVLVSSAPLQATDRPGAAKPVIAADREHIIVVAQDVTPSESRLVRWRRQDNAKWSDPEPFENYPAGSPFVGDPWLVTDRRGRFYLVHTSLLEGALAFVRSTDFGQAWSAQREITKGADRPVLGISSSGKHLVIATSLGERSESAPTEPLDGADPQLKAKIAAGVHFSAVVYWSQDRGRSWTRLPSPLPNAHAVPFSAVIDDEGKIASSWIAAQGESRSLVCSTIDRGDSWTETELVSNVQSGMEHPFAGERFPALAIGSAGDLYVAYIGPQAKGLFVRRSDDWNRWSEPLTLSGESADEVRMPAIAALGPMVHVAWMERLNGRWQMYYRGSRNCGNSWSTSLLLSVPHAGSSLIDERGFELTSDDDQACVADDGAGTIHVVWAVRRAQPSIPGRIWHATLRWERSVQTRESRDR